MYTLEEISALRQKCASLKLEGREILDRFSDEELQLHCNGIGPESLPAWARKFVSMLHPTLEPAAFIHDAEWSASECSKEHFSLTNARFKSNGYTCARAAYKWYNPLRCLVMNQARRFGNYCEYFGFSVYKEAKACSE